jgi:hypothetical protein
MKYLIVWLLWLPREDFLHHFKKRSILAGNGVRNFEIEPCKSQEDIIALSN